MNKFVKTTLSAFLIVSMGISGTQVFADGGNSKYFADVNENSYAWAVPYVDSLAAKGIATGVGNNMFDPASPIKRGDFAVFLDKTFDYEDGNGDLVNFVDVTEDKYYYQSVVNAKLGGAITDVYNYYPEENIIRLDAIKMIYNGLDAENYVGPNASTGVSMYADSNEIYNVTDQIAVGTLTKIGIITGSSDGKLHPNDTLTRAEMAVVIAKTSDYIDSVEEDIKKAEEEKLEQEKEDSMAVKEEDEEKTLVSSGNINESIVADSGKKLDLHDVTLSIPEQDKEALIITGGSEVSLKQSSIKTEGFAGILLSDKSTLNVENVKINAENCVGIQAENDTSITGENLSVSSDAESAVDFKGANVSIKEFTASNTNGGPALKMSAGGNVAIEGGLLETTGKENNLVVINSNPEDSGIATKLDLNNVKINNINGALFNIRETTVDVMFKECAVELYRLLDVGYNKNNDQENGNNINIAINDAEIIGDIYVDHKTKLTLDIQDDGYYKGVIDQNLYSQDINIRLAANGKLELMNDIYVNEFIAEDLNFFNIIDNGFNIYYNDANQANYELYSDTYNLTYGGKLLPM